MQAERQRMSGNRWHFQHGPIDIVIGADGNALALEKSHDLAWLRFRDILTELVGELPLLRASVKGRCLLKTPVARRMRGACHPYRDDFITPVTAVAGDVAQELIPFYQRPGIRRAWVNNGGDVALHLVDGEVLRVGLFSDLTNVDSKALEGEFPINGAFCVDASLPVRGIATSGWRGRSFSLGIADSVAVLSRTAAGADAAATVIANAVNLDLPCIKRRPACQIREDSDLGDRLVTVDMPRLHIAEVRKALLAGLSHAFQLRAGELIWSAVLVCQWWYVTTMRPLEVLPLPSHGGTRPSRASLLSFA